MAQETIKAFAEQLGVEPDNLLEQLKSAGVDKKTIDDEISMEEKTKFHATIEKESTVKTKVALTKRKDTVLKGGTQVTTKKTKLFNKKSSSEIIEEQEKEKKRLEEEAKEQARIEAELIRKKQEAEKIEAEKQKAKEAEEAKKQAAKKEAEEKAKKEQDAKKRKEAEEAARLHLEAEEAKRKEAQAKQAESKKSELTPEELEAKEAEKERRKQEEKKRAEKLRRERANPDIFADDLTEIETDEEVKNPLIAKVKEDKKASTNKSSKQRVRGNSNKEDDFEDKRHSLRGRNRGKNTQQDKEHAFAKPTAPVIKEVEIPESIVVSDLAAKMAIKAVEVVKTLFNMGAMVTINQTIDQETAAIVVEELGHKPKLLKETDLEETLLEGVEFDGKTVTRAPVVTVMGHVDHGKTSLLDYLRRTKVATGEAGGITQHIGAYQVETPKGLITFLDTPGHAAFTAMRARGAKVTDVVILVVAADDGVMPQTIEAIQHSRAAKVPLVVAVNKIDKPAADTDRVLQELSQHGVISDKWGGDTQFAFVSAKTGEGIDSLLESVLLEAEILELTAMEDVPAKGVVVESSVEKGKGSVATVLVMNGSLKKGDMVLAGLHYGRVRALIDDTGKRMDEAGPSMPAEITGLSGVPDAGDEFLVLPDEKKAREVALFRQGKYREVKLARQQKSKLENMFTAMKESHIATLNIVLKVDVGGSLEAISSGLKDLETDEIKVNIVSSAVGGISESDVNLAVASDAIIIGFNVRANTAARNLVAKEDVDLRYYSIIYELFNEIKQAMSGKLAPEFKEEIIGIADVKDVFRSSKLGAIAGCSVREGSIYRNKKIRVLRENVVIYEGELESLRHYKDDVDVMKIGQECGIGVKNYNDIKVGDKIEVFDKVKVERSI